MRATFQGACLAALLVSVLACGEPAAVRQASDAAALALVATYAHGDPIALARDEDGGGLWSVDGAMITRWSMGDPFEAESSAEIE